MTRHSKAAAAAIAWLLAAAPHVASAQPPFDRNPDSEACSDGRSAKGCRSSGATHGASDINRHDGSDSSTGGRSTGDSSIGDSRSGSTTSATTADETTMNRDTVTPRRGRLGARRGAQASPAGVQPLPRWDVTGMFGWRGVHLRDSEFSYDNWDSRGTAAAIVGYYWTEHLKAEADVGSVFSSRFTTYRRVTIDNSTFPPSVYTEHDASGVPISARFLYQFGENQWFHPFAGAGVALDSVRDRTYTPEQTYTGARRPDGSFERFVLADGRERGERTTHDVNAILIIGFKAYPNERVFMRTDLLWTVGRTAPSGRYTSWRIGMGVDF